MRHDIVNRLGGIFQQLLRSGLTRQTDSVMLILNWLVNSTDQIGPEVLQQELTKAFSTLGETLMPTLAEHC